MAISKPPTKASQNKSKLSALKNLVANVAKGANATRRAAAKVAAAKLAASGKGTPPLRQPAPAPGARHNKAPYKPMLKTSPKPVAKPARTRGQGTGVPATRLNLSVFAASTGSQVGVATGAAGELICREVACEALGTTGGYCRLHYIKNWRKIQRKVVILQERKLNGYIEELVAKYPDKYIEAIRLDLADDRAFAKVIADLDLDESVDDFEGDGENVEAVIDTIKRDFEEDPEAF